MKGSRFVTHRKRLKDPEVHVPKLYARAEALGDKLGPVLWQLPPQFHRDDARLQAFLAALPAERKNAVEFRHPSWFDPPVYDLLRHFRVALCVANSNGQNLPPEPLLTADWTYLRFHSGLAGGDYTEEQLRDWAGRIASYRSGGIATYAYFNNDWQGFAPKNATRLKELVGDGQ